MDKMIVEREICRMRAARMTSLRGPLRGDDIVCEFATVVTIERVQTRLWVDCVPDISVPGQYTGPLDGYEC